MSIVLDCIQRLSATLQRQLGFDLEGIFGDFDPPKSHFTEPSVPETTPLHPLDVDTSSISNSTDTMVLPT